MDDVANTSVQQSGSLISSLSDGLHNLTIVVVDPLGNQDKETVLFTIDTIPPTVIISSPTSLTYYQSSVSLTYLVSEGAVIVYTDGIANATSQENSSIISGLTDGNHTITIVAIDEAGNIGSATVEFIIDTSTTTTPEISVIYSTSVVYQTTWTTQTKNTAEITTLAIFAGILGIFLLRKRRISKN